MELVSQIVATFYDFCSEIWRRSRATESLKSRTENTSGGMKIEENDQPEELSNVTNHFGHDDNEGEKFDDEKPYKIPSGLSIKGMKGVQKNKTAL